MKGSPRRRQTDFIGWTEEVGDTEEERRFYCLKVSDRKTETENAVNPQTTLLEQWPNAMILNVLMFVRQPLKQRGIEIERYEKLSDEIIGMISLVGGSLIFNKKQ